ncbi:F-box/kelch-repeat protein At1g57790-like isoform X2 [Papaver somniferum]|uniref:F-box/kelch-repeat protein At1g57790-like isoform X2 n=1 Tax=Papaver somniferum TaxID=3469 RepID=UPI000E6FAD0B|nr:F-box/kelch-repeat protein At1g57790-like isoform X2 [Papaver somniferum]
MYDLEDKTVMLSLPCPDLPKPWFSPNWLMIPATIWNNEDRQRGTEFMSGNNSDGGNNIKAMEKLSLEISTIRTVTSINSDAEKEDIEVVMPWDRLSNDIVWFISSYLSPLDCLHFRAVCRNYQSVLPIVNWRKFCYTRSLRTTVPSPWMVFPKDNESVYSFINPMHNDENYLTSIPEVLKGSRIHYSKGGWLLMSKGEYTVFFYNPFTKAVIKLPDLPDDGTYRFRGISFSSLPTSSDCIVFVVSNYTDSLCITFIKRGDKMWTSDIFEDVLVPPDTPTMDFVVSLNSPIFYEGAFCCLDLNGTLGVFTLCNLIRWEAMISPPNCGFTYKSYLVELGGKLLSVLLGHYGKWVRIFRLDMSELVWVEVNQQYILYSNSCSD